LEVAQLAQPGVGMVAEMAMLALQILNMNPKVEAVPLTFV
jgi:hypothetical protein